MTKKANVIGSLMPTLSPKWWFITFLVWTVIAILLASQAYLELAYVQGPPSQADALPLGRIEWAALFLPTLLRWYVWALFTPFILRLAEKFPVERPLLGQRLLKSAGVGILITLLAISIMSLIQRLFGSDAAPPGIGSAFPPRLLTFWAILAVGHLVHYQRKSREQELQKIQLEARLAEAQLRALRSQLNPHFLFNTLHAISAMMHLDVEAADQMLVRLSDLLRYNLEEIGDQFSTLQAELHFVRLYLEIEQIRFQDRLTVSISAPPELLLAQMPTMLLQPIVENAVRYSVAALSAPGQIKVMASRNNGSLVLEVMDDGPGLPENYEEGLGLANTQSRLQQLYPDNHQFELRNRSDGGLSVQLTLPLSPYQEKEIVD